jgi:hypothetical protein
MDQDPQDIRARSLQYSLRAIKLYRALQESRDGAGWIIGKQFLRAATSIGANVEEAQAGRAAETSYTSTGLLKKKQGRAATGLVCWLRRG